MHEVSFRVQVIGTGRDPQTGVNEPKYKTYCIDPQSVKNLLENLLKIETYKNQLKAILEKLSE